MKTQLKTWGLILSLFLAVGCSVKPWDDGGGVDPNPNPGPAAKLWVVVVESPKRLNARPDIEAVLNGASLREYVKSHCAPGSDGKTPEFRIYYDSQDVSRESPAIRHLFTRAAEDSKAKGVEPWTALSNGKKVLSVAVPEGLEADGKTPKFVSLLQKYGGK